METFVPSLKIFGLGDSSGYAQKIADHLDIPLCSHTDELFDDGEFYIDSKSNVRGCDAYVISSLYGDEKESPADKLVKALFFCGMLKDASANRITLVAPYMSWMRQDRKVQPRAPIYTKYVPVLCESIGINRVLTMDVHNLSAFQTGFRCPTDHLEAKNLFAEHFSRILVNDGVKDNICVLSPDSGGVERTRYFRNKLSALLGVDIELAQVDKSHIGRVIKANKISGNVAGKKVIIYDDMISSGKSMFEADKTVKEAGGETYAICAPHGLFVGGHADEFLSDIPRIVVSDTIRPFRLKSKVISDKVHVVSTSALFAKAIKRIHNQGENDSISDLLV